MQLNLICRRYCYWEIRSTRILIPWSKWGSSVNI